MKVDCKGSRLLHIFRSWHMKWDIQFPSQLSFFLKKFLLGLKENTLQFGINNDQKKNLTLSQADYHTCMQTNFPVLYSGNGDNKEYFSMFFF